MRVAVVLWLITKTDGRGRGRPRPVGCGGAAVPQVTPSMSQSRGFDQVLEMAGQLGLPSFPVAM